MSQAVAEFSLSLSRPASQDGTIPVTVQGTAWESVTIIYYSELEVGQLSMSVLS